MSRVSKRHTATCPHCKRIVSTDNKRIVRHATVQDGTDYCPMSRQHVPITGNTAADYLSRAYLIGDLAQQIQDRDVAVVWTVLENMPKPELQRMLQLALAAIPIDQTVDEMFGWVCDLPVAKAVSA